MKERKEGRSFFLAVFDVYRGGGGQSVLDKGGRQRESEENK